jgi:hypothetical protein
MLQSINRPKIVKFQFEVEESYSKKLNLVDFRRVISFGPPKI